MREIIFAACLIFSVVMFEFSKAIILLLPTCIYGLNKPPYPFDVAMMICSLGL